jgi:hypothetical protein
MKLALLFPLRKKAMRNITTFALLLGCLSSVGWAGAPPRTERRKLAQPAEIQGYPCAKGYAWFYTDGKLQRCIVSQETQFGEALVPIGSIIDLKPDGSRDGVQMARSTRIHDVLCDGGGFLGPAEGAWVGFYPSGKLKGCYLVGNQDVQGVPCAHGGFFASLTGPDPGTNFYESGSLHSCRLSRDFNGQKKNTTWKQAEK